MPATSKSQQRLMGMVHAYKKGKLKHAPKKIRDVAKHISDEDARDFAKTKHDGLEEKKAFDFAGIMSKLEKMAAGTKVVVYKNDNPTEFNSLTEAAAFIAQNGSIPISKVEKMLSQRQEEINGLMIEYPVAEESTSGGTSGVQDLASMFKGLTGSYGSGSYGNVKLSSVFSKKATDKVDESMFLPREGEVTDRHRQVAKLLVDLFNKHKKSPEIRPVGTLSRSSVGYDQLTKKDLEGAGFLPSLIAVPEKGQSQLTTYRHPLNGLHFHRHDDNWLFHDDTYASMQMLIKKYQIEHPGASRKDVLKFALKDAIPKSMGHIVHEGSPGYVNYIYGAILGKPGFIEGGNPTAARRAKGVLGAVGGVMGASRMLTGKWNPITSAGIAGGFLGSTALSNIIGNAVGAQPPGWKNTILRAGLPIAGTIASAVGAHKLQKAWNESVERKRREKERRRRLKEKIRQQALKKKQIGKAAELIKAAANLARKTRHVPGKNPVVNDLKVGRSYPNVNYDKSRRVLGGLSANYADEKDTIEQLGIDSSRFPMDKFLPVGYRIPGDKSGNMNLTGGIVAHAGDVPRENAHHEVGHALDLDENGMADFLERMRKDNARLVEQEAWNRTAYSNSPVARAAVNNYAARQNGSGDALTPLLNYANEASKLEYLPVQEAMRGIARPSFPLYTYDVSKPYYGQNPSEQQDAFGARAALQDAIAMDPEAYHATYPWIRPEMQDVKDLQDFVDEGVYGKTEQR